MPLLSSLNLSSRLLVPDRLVAPVIVTSGLQLHFDASYSPSYPGSGDVWTDLSGNARNGTLQGDIKFNTANRGTLDFDGVNDYVSVDSDSALNPSYITIAAWVKLGPSGSGFVITKGYDGSDLPYSLCLDNESGIGGMGFYTSSIGWINTLMATDIQGDNQWHYVAGMFDGTTLSYYRDGVLEASTSAASGLTLPSTTLPLDIGRYEANYAYMTGSIAAVHIYNRAISGAEILSNFNSTKGRFGL